MKDVQATPKINPYENYMAERSHEKCLVPGNMIPSFVVDKAFSRGVANKFLINTWGGLGDQICAEPAIRFALRTFKNVEISLASRCPSIFSHLQFKEVFDTRETTPNWDDYLVFQTIQPPSTLLWEFASHMITHCVDFPSICMFRCTLPNADKEIKLPYFEIENPLVKHVIDFGEKVVIVHAGKHWESKTFPVAWWDQMIEEFKKQNFTVVLIGHEVDENVGFVKVTNLENVIDLRNKLTIKDFITLLTNCKFLFSNDSSPIHAAAAGNAYIGFVATCKHPDYLMHWRHTLFGWRMRNYGRDGIWNHLDYSPAQESEVTVEKLPDGLMEAILPCPKYVAEDFAKRRSNFSKNICGND